MTTKELIAELQLDSEVERRMAIFGESREEAEEKTAKAYDRFVHSIDDDSLDAFEGW